jgi:hypothetical protein
MLFKFKNRVIRFHHTANRPHPCPDFSLGRVGLGMRTNMGLVCRSAWDIGSALQQLAPRFLLGTYDLDTINAKTLAATPFLVFPSYVHVVRAGMAMVGVGGVGTGGIGNDSCGARGQGFGAGHGGGRTSGGGGARGGRHGHGSGYDYNNHNEDDPLFNGPRFDPNLGSHPPNYGSG